MPTLAQWSRRPIADHDTEFEYHRRKHDLRAPIVPCKWRHCPMLMGPRDDGQRAKAWKVRTLNAKDGALLLRRHLL